MKRSKISSGLIAAHGSRAHPAFNRRIRVLSMVAAASVAVVSNAIGAEYTWSNLAGGSQAWDSAANWGGTGFPSMQDDKADLSVNLAADLTANIPVAGVTVSTLSLGGTGNAVKTDIAGGLLTFQISTAPAIIVSGGVAGSNNVISAPVALGSQLDIDATSSNNLTIGGDVSMTGAGQAIINHMVNGQQLVFNGAVNLYQTGDPATGLFMTPSGDGGAMSVYNGPFVSGTTGSGIYFNGPSSNSATSYMTHYLKAASPNLTNGVGLGRSTLILGNDLALGTGTVTGAAGARSHIQSDDSSRKLANNFFIQNGFVFDGNHSITLDGWMTQGNNRALDNNIAAGSTLTFTGANNGDSIYIFESTDIGNREFQFDGSGNTVVQGRIRDTEDPTVSATHHINKRGSGTLTLTNANNDYHGETRANGGLLNFAVAGSWGEGPIVANALGGIWYTPGSADTDFSTFIGKIDPNSVGALAIPASEAATNFDFTSAPLSNVASMSIGAQGAVTYTGTVTPGANGYFWGAMSGTLTLGGTNQMTGSANVTYRNGGTVAVTANQDYTGVTTIAGANLSTGQLRAENRDSDSTRNLGNIFTTTTLEISSIANGGVASPLGASSSDAVNLVINGGTLRYTGASGSTDRLFTMGTFGATLDASGSGPVVFSNPGAIVGADAGDRTLGLAGSNAGDNTLASVVSDVGGVVSLNKSGAGKWILTGSNTYTGVTTTHAGKLVLAGGAKAPVLTGAGADIQGGRLVLDYNDTGTAPDVKSILTTGYGQTPKFSTGQIRTSNPEATDKGLGWKDDSAAKQVTVGYTYYGDANLDGQVDVTDLGALATNWQTSNVWAGGDFNYDGFVDVTDLGALATNWQKGVGSPLGPGSLQAALTSVGLGNVSVPEPASIGAIGICLAAAASRRRMRRTRDA